MRSLIASRYRRPLHVGLVLLPLLVFAAVASALVASDFPPLTGRVVDEAGLLSPSERESLTQALAQHEQATGQQVVVVTLRSLRDQPIEDYGYQLGRHWEIGTKDKNTGVLFIIAPRERKVRIEVGYGLEGTLTDAASRLIIENIVLPAFRSGQFGPGIVAGTGAILKTLASDEGAEPQPPKQARSTGDEGAVPLIVLFIVLLFVLSAMARYRRPSPGGLYGRRSADWRTGGMIGGLGGGMSGGWGGGDGGGGFSGGGGSFGGGGASGDW